MGLSSFWIAGTSNSNSTSFHSPLICGRITVLAVTLLIGLCNTGVVDGAKAAYIFGDSFVDTGNGGSMWPPYGIAWPGYPAGRYSDGRNQADYFAELFGLPSPTPYLLLKNDSESLRGVNFGRSGAGITYAFGITALDAQVDELESLVERGVLAEAHLRKSVALVSIGVNDYGSRNTDMPFQETSDSKELETTVTTVVDGIALNVLRIHGLGIRNIVVANLPLLACTPYVTAVLQYRFCASGNSTLLNETSIHNTLLQRRVRLLNQELQGSHIIIVDQTNAFKYLFEHGSDFGFKNTTLTPCCTGKNSSYSLTCGYNDSEGNPIYKVCEDTSKVVIFDAIHPTQAAWKVVISLYANDSGFTLEGPNLLTWITKYDV